MPQTVWTWTKNAIEKLVAQYRDQQRQISNLRRRLATFSVRRHQTSWKPARVYICKTGEAGIPAMADGTPGVAEVTIYRFDKEDALVSTGRKISVFNIASSDVAGETFIQAKEELASHRLVADFEDCGNGA